jgi:hypothetical protein
MKNLGIVKIWLLAFAIAIVLNLFVNYGISVFYESPQYDDFCQDVGKYRPYETGFPIPAQEIASKDSCAPIDVSQELRDDCNEQKAYISYHYNSTGCPTEAYCETCGVMFDDVNQKHNSNVFIVLVVIGVGVIVGGVVIKTETVANGFIIGGIISLIVATMRTWGQLSDIIKFLILGAVLALLIWLGYKKSKGK